MAITERYKDMSAYYRFTPGDKLIINNLTYLDSDDMEEIQRKLTTVYDNEVISSVPTCDCGAVRGRYRLGNECVDCGSIVIDPKSGINPILWLESLGDDIPFINVAFWNSLNRQLSNKVDSLRWLSDNKYNPPHAIPVYLQLAKNEVFGGVRDYRNMVGNFDKFMDYIINSTELKARSSYYELELLYKIYTTDKNRIFTKYLPIHNKKLFVMENTSKGKYTSLVLGNATDVVTMWLKASSEGTKPEHQAYYTGRAISMLADTNLKIYDTYLLSKHGSFRKHNYGARSHFTFRTVISASNGKHRHDDIVPPWLVALTTFRPHMINKLIKRGYSYSDVDKLLNTHVMTYNHVLHEVMSELIAESPDPRGLPVLVNRNPSLLQGSTQYMYIPRFNSDPSVLTTQFSPLAAKSCNADFDGDRNQR